MKNNRNFRRSILATLALAITSITFAVGIASPASAAKPKSDWNWICDMAGGTYYNTAWGELCVINGQYIWAD